MFNKQPKVSKRPEIPYVTGHAVGGNRAFIGRTDILQAIDSVLRRSQQNAIVLFGQRRIGKTSVLKELEAKLPEQGNYQPVFLDLMDKAHQPLEVILNDLAKTISQRLDEEEPQWENTSHQFGKWLAELLESEKLSQKSLVLLFDEFDALNDTQAEQMRDEFFRYLRTELLPINPKRLNFIFAIGRNVGDFKTALALFKNMISYRVSLLSDKETERLIRLSENNHSLHWSHKTVRQIWELTHGHAYLTQLLCDCTWNQLWNQNPTHVPTITSTKVIAQSIPCVFNQGQVALEWLWDGLPPACKIVTAAFAELGKKAISQKKLIEHLHASGIGTVIDELEMAPNNLKEWDIIEGDKQKGYHFRVELFRQWVVKHKPLTEIMQEELGRIRVEAEQYYQEGKMAAQNKRFDEAIDKLSTAIRINSHHPDAQKLLAKVFVEKGEIAEAQTALEKFYSFYPEVARPQLTELLWTQVESHHREEDQLALCEQIIEYDKDHLNAKNKIQTIWKQRAERHLRDDDCNEAIKAYRIAGLKNKAAEIQKKCFWDKYSKLIVQIMVFLLVLLLSYLATVLKLGINIPWWLWGSGLGIIIALLIGKMPKGKTRDDF